MHTSAVDNVAVGFKNWPSRHHLRSLRHDLLNREDIFGNTIHQKCAVKAEDCRQKCLQKVVPKSLGLDEVDQKAVALHIFNILFATTSGLSPHHTGMNASGVNLFPCLS